MRIGNIECREHLLEIATTFLKIGAMSYGGPAIKGIMQAEVQEKRQWLSKPRFVEGLALVNMLPGPGATQLGIFLGHTRAGWQGGIVAGLSFMLPAFFIMLALTLVYAAYGTLPALRSAFYGIGPAVIGATGASLAQMIPHAAPDALTFALLLSTIVLMLLWRLGPLPLMVGGAGLGIARRGRIWERLREIAP